MKDEVHTQVLRKFDDSETKYCGDERERSLVRDSIRYCWLTVVILTKIIVTSVNRTMMFPCCFVDSDVNLADLASETFACFCFKSRRWLSFDD